jgi:L-fuculose-phosphate aldolase
MKADQPRREVADGCQVLAWIGQADFIWGHAGMRDPEGRGVWIKRRGIGFDEVRPDDVHLVDESGTVLEGGGEVHGEVHIHTQVLKMHPRMNAVVHTHAPGPVALAALRQPVLPVSHEGTFFAPTGVPVFDETGALIATPELGRRAASRLGQGSAMILRNHGIVTAGVDMAHAVAAATFLERACAIQLRCVGGGEALAHSDPEEAGRKRNQCYSETQIREWWAYVKRQATAARGGAGKPGGAA